MIPRTVTSRLISAHCPLGRGATLPWLTGGTHHSATGALLAQGGAAPPLRRSWADQLRESLLHYGNRNAGYFGDRLQANQRWRLFPDFRGSCAYLDIETTGLGQYGDHITTIALYDGEYLRVTEAVLRIFDRQEWLRVNRARARIKVFVDKFGIDELRRQAEEELQGDWVKERDFDVAARAYVHDEEANAPAPRPQYASPNGDLSAFERFRRTNVMAQRQKGFSAVEVAVITVRDMVVLIERLRSCSVGMVL